MYIFNVLLIKKKLLKKRKPKEESRGHKEEEKHCGGQRTEEASHFRWTERQSESNRENKHQTQVGMWDRCPTTDVTLTFCPS